MSLLFPLLQIHSLFWPQRSHITPFTIGISIILQILPGEVILAPVGEIAKQELFLCLREPHALLRG